MKTTNNTFLIFSLKIVALLTFVYLTNEGFMSRLHYLIDYKNYTTLAVFGVLWFFSILVMLSVCFHQKTLIRVFWAIVIAFTTAVSYGFYAAGGSELDVLDVLELWQARHETGRAFEHFRPALIKASIIALFGFIILAYPMPKVSHKNHKLLGLSWLLPIIPVVIFCCLIFIDNCTVRVCYMFYNPRQHHSS